MELEGLVPNTPNIAVSICYIDAIFLCNELVTVFFTSCSEGSLTHVSGFVLTTNLILFPDMDKYRGSFSILLTTKVKLLITRLLRILEPFVDSRCKRIYVALWNTKPAGFCLPWFHSIFDPRYYTFGLFLRQHIFPRRFKKNVQTGFICCAVDQEALAFRQCGIYVVCR